MQELRERVWKEDSKFVPVALTGTATLVLHEITVLAAT
jgi:hypothetical protein